MRSIQQRFQKMMGFAPCLFYGRGLTSIQSRGFLPYARPITTVGEHRPLGRGAPAAAGGADEDSPQQGRVRRQCSARVPDELSVSPCHQPDSPPLLAVGEPVMVPKIENPSCEMVDTYHEMYICSLLKLFNENKTKYGLSETDELHIL